MSNLNKSLISDFQTKTFEEKIKASVNGVDLYWLGYDHTSDLLPSSVERYGVQANINRVLLWLSSKPNDYIRESLKGGILYSLLGQLTQDTNLEDWERIIKSRFNDEFANDLDLFYLKITPDKAYRKITINMIVRDKVTNNTFPLTTEATA